MIEQTFTSNGANAPARNVVKLTADDMIGLGSPIQLCAATVTMPDGRVGIAAISIDQDGRLVGKVSDYSHHVEAAKQLRIRPERRPQ
jgi:hypothetical protein